MITYVNTVLVSNKNGEGLATAKELAGSASLSDLDSMVGKFAFMNCDPCTSGGGQIKDVYAMSSEAKRFKIGVVTSEHTEKQSLNGVTYIPVVKWSNIINAEDIKTVTALNYTEDTEDTVIIDFSKIPTETLTILQQGGCPISLRLTFKDMPMRFRKWTETYSYTTQVGDTIKNIITGLASDILRNPKRQRVYVNCSDSTITLTAMKYDDDNKATTENVYAKCRFDANMYWKNPNAPGWASNNYNDLGVIIKKTQGKTYPATAKLVRDRERSAFDYAGTLHRCCWYDPQPDMVTDLNTHYNGIIIEFENAYHTADDLTRKTKQTLELYSNNTKGVVTLSANDIAGGLLNLLQVISTQRTKLNMPINNSDAYAE